MGIEIRNADGDVLFVLGIHDGEIYFGNAYADPNITNIVMNPSPTSSSDRVVIDGVEYVSIRFSDSSGTFQLLNVRADLWDAMTAGGMEGAIATYFVSLAIADSLPNFIGNSPDMDGDGDRDFQDWASALEQALRDQQSIAISNGHPDSLVYNHLANTLPDIIGDLGNTADSVTTDDNLPPPGDEGGPGDGGAGPEGDSGWLF